MFSVDFTLQNFEYFLLILTRISMFVVVAPFFNTRNTPVRVKIGFSAIVSLMLYFVVDFSALNYSTVVGCAFLVVREALTTTDNSLFIVISYALGFSTGTYIGGLISNRYIKGYMSVYVISDKYEKLVSVLRDNEFGVSTINIKGMNNDKVMLLIQINSSSLDKLKSIINKYDSKAFVIINDTKYVQNGFIKR